MRITGVFHPRYLTCMTDYDKWRLTYIGGRPFINAYLEKFDTKEDAGDFTKRKTLTYCPALAKEGVYDVRNSIYQRMPEISRQGGSDSYTQAVLGKDGGIDLLGNTMNTYLGKTILPELLSMGRVGVYVDMPKFDPNATLAEIDSPPRPYLYHYTTEDIVNWAYVTRENQMYYSILLLREYRTTYDEATGMPVGEKQVYRYMRLKPNPDNNNKLMVKVEMYVPGEPEKGKIYLKGEQPDDILIEEFWIDLPRIPFVLFDIGDSLLKDICDYQVALLNLSSSDLSYALKSNFPFYTEPYDPRTEEVYKKKGPINVDNVGADGNTTSKEIANKTSDPQEIVLGTMRGRRFPEGSEPPRFINPSSEPLTVSMAKQEQMKKEIKELLNLAIELKSENGISDVDSGLTAIGMQLEAGEREIAKVWELYFNKKNPPAIVTYPTTFSLKTDQQRLEEAKEQQELKTAAPSITYQKEMSKKLIRTVFEGRAKPELLNKMLTEVDAAKYISSDSEEITKDIANGLVGKETASIARGYDGKTEVPIAQKEHADTLAEMVVAQTKGAAANAARGTPTNPTDKSATLEKTASQKVPELAKNPSSRRTRGPGK